MDIEKEIGEIRIRNKRVEADKAWEVSISRRAFITLITYAIAFLWMLSIDVDKAALSALVPTGGYVLSTLSLPPLKGWWIRRHQN